MAAAGFAAVAALQEIVRGKDVFAVFDVVIFAFNDWGQIVGFLFGIGGHGGDVLSMPRNRYRLHCRCFYYYAIFKAYMLP